MKLFSVTFFGLLLAACNSAPQNQQTDIQIESDTIAVNSGPNLYDVNAVYEVATRDTLLTDMVTFIYRKPSRATAETRTNPEFRAYYVEHLSEFEWIYYHITSDSVHYYYLIRPARSVQGNLRGVGGKFRLDANMKLQDFEETYNTTIMGRTELISSGKELFEHHIQNDNVDQYLGNPAYIEWPDNRLKYSKEKREWRYDV